MNDLRFAIRQLLKNPGFTLVAILALALGIAVNTAIFSLTNALLLRPVPQVSEPDRLVQLGASFRGEGFSTLPHGTLRAIREQSSTLSGVTAYSDVELGLSHAAGAERVRGQIVSANYFDVLGVRMGAGRGFLPEEENALNAAPVAVISHGFWERFFGGDPGVVGKRININAQPFTVVGIAPPGFAGTLVTRSVEVWVPISMLAVAIPDFDKPAEVLASHIIQWHWAFARLEPAVTVEQAQVELNTIIQRVQATLADPTEEAGMALVRGLGFTPATGSSIPEILALLQVVVGLVLLIPCANVANMQLARGATRIREVGIRLALGATRWRIARQLLVENLVLALFALISGILLSFWFTHLLVRMGPADVASTSIDISADWRVLVFAAGAALCSALGAGLFPAWQAGRSGVVTALRDSSAQSGSSGSRLRNSFVIAQIALSLLLLVGAGLFVRTFQSALRTHPGYAVDSVLVASVDLRLQGYSEPKGRQYFADLITRLKAVPGVEAVGLAPFSPFTGATFGAPLQADGGSSGIVQAQANFSMVSEDFFNALQIPLLQGRQFLTSDTAESAPVAILDRATAKALFPDGEIVGRQIRMGSMNGFRTLEVVGMVEDIRYRTLLNAPEKTVYLPFAQNYLGWGTLHIRSSADPATLLKPVSDVALSMDRAVPLHDVRPLAVQLDRALWQQKFSATLMSIFGLLALALAALGLYGVISYSVNQRTRELGVRIALGARSRDVLQLVLREASTLLLIGSVVGAFASLVLARLVTSQLYGVSAADPLTYVGVLLLLGMVGLVASYLPARRATKVDPMVALRAE